MPEQFARYGERGIPFGYTGVGVLESAGAGIALANESDAHSLFESHINNFTKTYFEDFVKGV